MSPEALELVEMLLDLARPAARPGFFHEVEDEFFHCEWRLSFIEGGPDAGPVRRQSSEADDVAVLWYRLAAIRRIDMPDETQKPHQPEERVTGHPPGAKRPMKLEAGVCLEDGVRNGGQAEL